MSSSHSPKQWIPGCYGLTYPATVVAGDAMIYRVRRTEHANDIELLTTIRGSGSWEVGERSLTVGGFIDPPDESVQAAVMREIQEEVPGINVTLESHPFVITGPQRYKHYWDSTIKQAVATDTVMPDIPSVVLTYRAAWQSGEPEASDEMHTPTWVPLATLTHTTQSFAFDHAFLLGRFIEHTTQKYKKPMT